MKKALSKIWIFLGAFSYWSLALAIGLTLLIDLSPRNSHRPFLRQVNYIVLHTTEAPTPGTLGKLKRYGEAHYVVDIYGRVTQIMEENREARHAGHSVWNGRYRIDEVSIGIEVEGYHNKPLTHQQEQALAVLLRDLRARYQVSDDRILTHSMVAYGVPNRWHKFSHRGRKRCGMQMADPRLRARLGIGPGPSSDPDVSAQRLRVGDPYLFKVLFDPSVNPAVATQAIYNAPDANVISPQRSAWFIAREKYDQATTVYTLPSGARLRGTEVPDWAALPTGTKVTFVDETPEPGEQVSAEQDVERTAVQFREIGKDGETAYSLAHSEYASSTTIYFLADGRVRTGAELRAKEKRLLDRLPRGTKVLVGYVNGGFVTRERSVSRIAGTRWSSPATLYRFADGRILTGDEVNPRQIPLGTLIFFER